MNIRKNNYLCRRNVKTEAMMTTTHNNISAAKPFVKWVGGKGQLLQQLKERLLSNFDCSTQNPANTLCHKYKIAC